MATFIRSEHYRTNAYGTTFRVREHSVRRDHWNIDWFARFYGSPAYKAADFLRRSKVGRGVQGCFVVPNAKCPVCGVPVFYYANQFGSRVYFDDLGPPWPKHPCTDQPRTRQPLIHDAWKPITRRKRGEIQELIGAANTLGFLKNKQFGVRSKADWSLTVIEEVVRSGERNDVKASLIDSADGARVTFYCFSSEPLFESGDMISISGSEFSFVEKENLAEVRFRNGDRIAFKGGKPLIERAAGSNLPSTSISPPIKKAPTFDPSLYNKVGWRKSIHRQHYQNGNLQQAAFLKLATDPVTRLLQEGALTPRELSDGLNGASFRTAAGASWTPLLAKFLVFLIKEQQQSEYREKLRAKQRTRKRSSTSRRVSVKNNESEIASKREEAARAASAFRRKNATRVEQIANGKRVVEFVLPPRAKLDD